MPSFKVLLLSLLLLSLSFNVIDAAESPATTTGTNKEDLDQGIKSIDLNKDNEKDKQLSSEKDEGSFKSRNKSNKNQSLSPQKKSRPSKRNPDHHKSDESKKLTVSFSEPSSKQSSTLLESKRDDSSRFSQSSMSEKSKSGDDGDASSSFVSEYRDASVEEWYDRLLKESKLSEADRIKLNFYSEDFGSNLRDIFSSKGIKISKKGSLQNTFTVIIFKWLTFMKPLVADDGAKAERINKVVTPFAALHSNVLNILFSNDKEKILKSKKMIYELLVCQVFENSWVFPLFRAMVEGFYCKKSEIDGKRCELLKNHLKSNSFKSLIMDTMISLYDPKGEMLDYLRKSRPRPGSLESSPPITDINLGYLESIELDGPQDTFKISWIYVSHDIIRFFLKRGRKFSVSKKKDFARFIERLKEMKLLTKSMVEKVIEFDKSLSSSSIDSLSEYLSTELEKEEKEKSK